MGQLVYASIGSLDGFIADAQGNFDWSAPDEEVHAYLNDRDRGVTIELYGRRLYEVMKVWETYGQEPDAAAAEREYGDLAGPGQGRLLEHSGVRRHGPHSPRAAVRA